MNSVRLSFCRPVLLRWLAGCGAAMALTAPCTAQVAGYYEGLTSQGMRIGVSVVPDSSGGLVLAGYNVEWAGTCTRTGAGRYQSWGIGAGVPIATQQANHELVMWMINSRFGAVFSDQTVVGTFSARTPEFVDTTATSYQVQQCLSGSITFSANLVPGAQAPLNLKPGQTLRGAVGDSLR